MGGQTKYNLVGRTPDLGSWDTPATIVECVVAVKNHKGEPRRESEIHTMIRSALRLSHLPMSGKQ